MNNNLSRITRNLRILKVSQTDDWHEKLYGGSGENEVLIANKKVVNELSHLYRFTKKLQVVKERVAEIPVKFVPLPYEGSYFETSLKGVETESIGYDSVCASDRLVDAVYNNSQLEIVDRNVILKPSVPEFDVQGSFLDSAKYI